MNTLYKKATHSDLVNKPASGLNLSQEEILNLPKGSLFTDKRGAWQVKTKISIDELKKKLFLLTYRKKLNITKITFGEDNVFAIRCRGHRVSKEGTRKKFNMIPIIPQVMGHYHTYAFGHVEEFSHSTVEPGDRFHHDNNEFICIYAYRCRGDAESLSVTSVIAVRV